MDYERLMHIAIQAAQRAQGEVPVGALVINGLGEVVAVAQNNKERAKDPTSHAEIEVIRQAAKIIGDWRLDGCTLFVTLEPCVMCAGAVVAARLSGVVFGAWDGKAGASGSLYDILRDPRLGRPVDVTGGVLEAQCAQLLLNFFEGKR